MRSQLRIGRKTIGDGCPVFIVAEIGVTCNYDMTISKGLIDVVRDTGADAVKFIFWFPDEIMSDTRIPYEYETPEGQRTENMFEMLSKLRFTLEQWRALKAYADEQGVTLLSTVNSPSGVDYAERLGLEAYKLSSWDYNYFPLWRRVAALGKPVLIDTGPVNTLEVAKVVALMREANNDQGILLHTVHTDDHAEINMRSIPYMREAFGMLVGYSSKGRDSETDVMAVALGACVVEKRLTLDRRLPGHHQLLSLEPKEFGDYVRLVRNVQAALGQYDLRPSRVDLNERRRWFRHIVANQDIPKGTRLTPEMLEAKRPEAGVSPEYMDFFVGRTTKRDLARNEAISWDDV